MHLVAVGLNHKTAPVEIRERLAFNGPRLVEGVHRLISLPHIEEGIILSTCNRTELYAVAEEYHGGRDDVLDFVQEATGGLEVGPYLYRLSDVEVVQHLFRVVSGLDSMILGEPQILGQVKDAFHLALEENVVGANLGKLFRHAIEVGKKVRTETSIGENAVSVSYAAVELARKIFGDLDGKSILIIGAGKMSELTAKTLRDHGVSTVLVANRTYQKACQLAETFGGTAIQWDDLKTYLLQADIAISSTGAPHIILDADTIREVMRTRRNRSLFLIDIAVPRDIDPKAHELDGVYLYNIDDMQSVVEANLQKREQAAAFAEQIIAQEIKSFMEWMASREVVPLIKDLRTYGEEIQTEELTKLFNRMPNLSDKEKNLVTAMSRAIVNKLLHHPMVFLKELSTRKDRDAYVDFTRNLFNLNGSADPAAATSLPASGKGQTAAGKEGPAC